MGGIQFFAMSHQIFTIIADAAAAPGAAAGGFNPTPIVYMLCIFAIFYFLAIRPQSQRQKQAEAMIKAIKTGDRVITSSGIHGMVSNVKDTTVIVKIADNVKIELEKSSVGTVVKRDDGETGSAS
jgi:preprotein translocase subunit YajC